MEGQHGQRHEAGNFETVNQRCHVAQMDDLRRAQQHPEFAPCPVVVGQGLESPPVVANRSGNGREKRLAFGSRRLGEPLLVPVLRTVKVDVRVISATNKDLWAEVTAEKFREDLYYRLCVVPVHLPALRHRRNDIPLLAEWLLKKTLAEVGRKDVVLSPEAIEAMVDHDWPGNVRELENAIRYALVKCRDNLLKPEHFPQKVFEASPTDQPRPKRKRRRKLQLAVVERVLEETCGNKVEAARRLGVSRATLYRFLEDKKPVSS